MNTTHSDKTPALTLSAAWVKRRSGSQDATLFILENPFQGIAKVLFQKRRESMVKQ